MEFEETELRLGLPYGGGGGEKSNFTNGKRVFEETNDVDLKLNLSSMKETNDSNSGLKSTNHIIIISNIDDAVVLKPPAKAQVVGWPPVRSFRKNAVMAVHEKKKTEPEAFVKVSMDGAPYLRKVDLKTYHTYQQLYHALAKMFSSFTIGKCDDDDSEGMVKESIKLLNMDLILNGTSDYVPTYEDKDGDWMLVGDVPWEMFVESCKRLRIMKGTDAKGLAPKVADILGLTAPRAMEKCKTRS